MAQTCKKCGYVTEQVLANRCALCKEPYGGSGSLSAIAAANLASNAAPSADQSPTGRSSDHRSWFVKSVHRRSIGGMVLSGLMIAGGVMGSGFTRGEMTVSGLPLIGLGFVVLVISCLLFFATKRR